MQKVFKLPIVAIPILLLSLFIFYSCDSGGNSDTDSDFMLCDIAEMQERFANTDCLAEELATGCSNIYCSNRGMTGIGEKEISFSGSSTCTIIDCKTMECELRVGGSESILGLVSELVIEEMGGFPTGVFVIENQESPFDCVFIAVD